MNTKTKKKFPLPRVGSRKKSDDTFGNGNGSSTRSRSSVASSAVNKLDGSDRSNGSNRSRSLTPRGFGRKPSFKFRSRSKGNKGVSKSDDVLDDCSPSPSTSVGTDGGSVKGEVVVTDDGGPPALPTKTVVAVRDDEQKNGHRQQPQASAASAASAKKDVRQTISHQPHPTNTAEPQSRPLVQRTRSLTPSDIHYHTAPSGGVNAALIPITQHYATNQTLLDLFSTLYERDQFEVAYAVGVKFVEVALFTIPTHGYYKSGNAKEERTKSAADAVRVTKLLGGMVDELEEDEGRNEKGGVERIETLNKLASVAHESFEQALDDEIKQGNKQTRDDAASSKIERLWNDYIMGGEGPEHTMGHNLCSLPDNICSFWNTKKNTGYYDSENEDMLMDCYTDENNKEPVKKKTKIDTRSLPKQPEAIVIPQVFIKKPSVDENDEQEIKKPEENVRFGKHYHRKDSGIVRARGASDDDIMKVAVQPAATKKAPKAISGSVAKEEEGPHDEATTTGTQPMEVDDLITPKTRPSKSKATRSRGHRDSPLSILTESEATTVKVSPDEMMSEPAVVVKGRPVEQHVDADGFDKDSLHLALSLSMQDDEINVVSSSDDDAPSNNIISDQNNGKAPSISSLYREQYQSLRSKDKFHVRFLDTFQGRVPNSTNGCTVIAPLTCIQYFTSSEQNRSSVSSNECTWNNGIPDELINQVIDEHAATVLPEVRNKLNLEEDSFIIPSDVHDHLIEVGLLSTSQFVGVSGGNILNDDHLMSFKKSLLLLDDERERERLKGRKIAATFFFHGHVIALHVIVNGNDENDVWIELIDSLPNPDTWIDVPPSSEGEQERTTPTTRWSQDTDEEWERPPMEMEYDDDMIQNAIRVRCTDVEHFDTLIRHYACSKFSKEEQKFIDDTEWEDNNSYCEYSFDPRVFQAFIWAEAE